MITSTANTRVKAVRRLHSAKGRKAAHQTIVEGPNGLEALATSSIVPHEVFSLADTPEVESYCADAGVELVVVSNEVMAVLSDTRQPIGPVAVIAIPDKRDVRSADTVALVDVGDPGNVGTIVRTAGAFGWDVAVYGETADPWSPKALRASAGSILRQYLAHGDDPIEDAVANGLESCAMIVSGGEAFTPTVRPTMLLIGSEAHGLAPHVTNLADRRCSLPMAGDTESLNAAAAAAIGMFALS